MTRYPGYDVLSKWSTVSFDTLTRGVIRQRLAGPPERRFFTEAEFATLEAAAARLAPTPERGSQPPIAGWIDAELYEGRDEGWREEGRPPIPDGWRLGLKSLTEEAQAQYGRPFVDLDEATQVAFLHRVQAGKVDGTRWSVFPAKAFFADLLKSVAGVYYSYPQAWSEIGFGGPASPRGYVRIGLDEHDPWEAREAGQDRTQGSGG
jgi:hypothetical protein